MRVTLRASFLFLLLGMINCVRLSHGMSCIWSHIILGVPARMKPWTWIKQAIFPDEGGLHSLSWRPDQNTEADPPLGVRGTSYPTGTETSALLWLSSLLAFSLERTLLAFISRSAQAFMRAPELHQQLSWVSSWPTIDLGLSAFLTVCANAL